VVQAASGPSWNRPVIVREGGRVRTESAQFRRPTWLALSMPFGRG